MAITSTTTGTITVTAPTEEIATNLARKLRWITLKWNYFVEIETGIKEHLLNNNDGTVSVTFLLAAAGEWTFEEASKEFPNWAMEEGDFSEFKEHHLEILLEYTDLEPETAIFYNGESNLVKEAGEEKFQCQSFQTTEIEFNHENIAELFGNDFADDCFLE